MTRSSRRLVSTALCGASLTAATAASAQRSGDGAAQIAIAPETASRVRPWLETGDRADDACAVRDTSLVVVSTTHAVRVFDHATAA